MPPLKKRGGSGVEGKAEDRLRGCLAGRRKRGNRRRLQGKPCGTLFKTRAKQQHCPCLARCSSPGWVTASLGRSQLSGRDTVTQEEVSGMEFLVL